MDSKDALVKQVQAAIKQTARIDLPSTPIGIAFNGGTLTLEGNVAYIGVKRQAVRAAASVPGVDTVVDRLRVGSDGSAGDGATRDAVCNRLLSGIDFQNCSLRACVKGQHETLRESRADSSGSIDVAVDNGVVTLSGQVISLSHKRLAGVLAWWARGCRDLVNELSVVPSEDDNDDEIVDALRLVLESDPDVPAAQINIASLDGTVTLEGVVGSEGERARAEMDAWYVDGVDQVINRIEVR